MPSTRPTSNCIFFYLNSCILAGVISVLSHSIDIYIWIVDPLLLSRNHRLPFTQLAFSLCSFQSTFLCWVSADRSHGRPRGARGPTFRRLLSEVTHPPPTWLSLEPYQTNRRPRRRPHFTCTLSRNYYPPLVSIRFSRISRLFYLD